MISLHIREVRQGHRFCIKSFETKAIVKFGDESLHLRICLATLVCPSFYSQDCYLKHIDLLLRVEVAMRLLAI